MSFTQEATNSDRADHPYALVSLILGILGLVGLPILAPVAWALGSRAARESAAQPHLYRPNGLFVAGRILGIIGTVLLCVFVAGLIAFLVIHRSS